MDHNKLWKILKQMGILDHLTCLLRNLSADQEATIRTGHGTMNWFQLRKGACQGCILSPCLFKLYAEYIMRNAVLEEAQAGMKFTVIQSDFLDIVIKKILKQANFTSKGTKQEQTKPKVS